MLFFFLMFIYFEREENTQAGEDRKRGRERIPSRLHNNSAKPDVGLDLTNFVIMT